MCCKNIDFFSLNYLLSNNHPIITQQSPNNHLILSMSDDLWDQIIGAACIDMPENHCDDNVKNFIISICSSDFDKESEDFNLITDKDQQILCFFAACMFNHSHDCSSIISKIIDVYQIDPHYVNNVGDNCLTLACWKNTNLDVIKYLINDLMMDINWKNNYENNCLILACGMNTNLGIIQYLVNDLMMDPNHTNNNGDNCLTLACERNTCLGVIEYLTDDLKMDINHTNDDGDNCLTLACWENTNLEIIKYLINDLKMDPISP